MISTSSRPSQSTPRRRAVTSHPLRRGMLVGLEFAGGAGYDYVANRAVTLKTRTGGSAGEFGLVSNGVDTAGAEYNSPRLGGLTANGDLALAWHATNMSGTGILLALVNGGYNGIGVAANSVRRNSSGSALAAYTSTLSPRPYVYVQTSGTALLYAAGKATPIASGTPTFDTATLTRLWFLKNPYLGGSQAAAAGSLVNRAYVWNRALSAAEAVEWMEGYHRLYAGSPLRRQVSISAGSSSISFSSTSALSTAGAAAVSFGLSIASASTLLTGGSASVTVVGPPVSISSSSALLTAGSASVALATPGVSISSSSSLSTAGAAAVALTSPNVSISTASSLLTAGSASLAIVGPPLSISSASGLLTAGSAAVTLTSPNISVSSASAMLTGGSASVAIVGPPVSFSSSSALSTAGSASVTLAASNSVSIATASSLLTAGSASIALTGSPAGPQRAVYADIVARLVALGCFADGAVARGAPSEVLMRSGRQTPCAAVQPLAWVDSDRYDEGDFIRTCTFAVTLIVRMEEPEQRQDWLDYLTDRVCNALDGKSLADITFGPLTLIQRGQYAAMPQHPEQRAVLTGQFVYEVVGYGARDESEPT